MAGASFKDHFSAAATGYATHRPTYPAALAEALAALAPGRGLALDCGCGNGQLARLLAGSFDRVVATDASAAQIAEARPHPRIEFRVAPAEASGLPAACADLITAAQAAHWFDLPAFYAEARRVARPGAVLALIAYGVLHLDGAAEEVLRHFYTRVVGPYWPAERAHVEAGYRTLPFPFAELPDRATVADLAIEAEWSLADLVGYAGTWSALRGAEAALGASPLPAFARDLAAAWGDPAVRRRVRWPLALRLARL
ncbi:Trans-aconitate 2-methyltransferase [Methylobacterium hispanicum]|uniref:Trans-aconitate 2-methyltransferase n=1 Tax=Methylobacterium hispanicum TaxID=270350 RepID=A0AAV4ZF89_9HYPH|nr:MULTISPECIES: class I SAM-dependent methyltransferase [Methylobacterium]GJD86535.1 Trans-aconitate 2-methyltransferase [Methylobacterium hispanicum]